MASTAILQINLGTAAAFDPNVFPLAYYEEDGNLNKGTYLIRATLEEVEAINQLGIDLNEDFDLNTKVKLEALLEKRAKLDDTRKTRNPIKALLNYRAAWLFHAGARALYRQTIRTSETIHREEGLVRVVRNTQVQGVGGAVSPDALIGGMAVELPNGLNHTAQQTMKNATATMALSRNPFESKTYISQIRDGEETVSLADTASLLSHDGGSGVGVGNQMSVASSDLQLSHPSSPQSVVYMQFINSMVAPGSNLNAPTVSSGSRNSGASVTQEFAP